MESTRCFLINLDMAVGFYYTIVYTVHQFWIPALCPASKHFLVINKSLIHIKFQIYWIVLQL